MGILGDDLTPTDHILMGLGQGPTSEQLPLRMLCPANHEVKKELWRHTWIEESVKEVIIPFYLCGPCTIVYRYQECKLIPGDEGRPD